LVMGGAAHTGDKFGAFKNHGAQEPYIERQGRSLCPTTAGANRRPPPWLQTSPARPAGAPIPGL
jgi:hypothetical protein